MNRLHKVLTNAANFQPPLKRFLKKQGMAKLVAIYIHHPLSKEQEVGAVPLPILPEVLSGLTGGIKQIREFDAIEPKSKGRRTQSPLARYKAVNMDEVNKIKAKIESKKLMKKLSLHLEPPVQFYSTDNLFQGVSEAYQRGLLNEYNQTAAALMKFCSKSSDDEYLLHMLEQKADRLLDEFTLATTTTSK